MTTRRRFTAVFKAQVVTQILRGDKTLAQIAAEHSVHPKRLYKKGYSVPPPPITGEPEVTVAAPVPPLLGVRGVSEAFYTVSNQLSQWKATVLGAMPALFKKDESAQAAEKVAQEKQTAGLYEQIGRLTI